VFASLRLNGLVSGNDKNDKIDSTDTGQHVFDEPFMARHVYKCDAGIRSQIKVRETDVNGYASTLFFFQTVRFDAREGADESCFSVVDMSCGAGDNVFHDSAASSMPGARTRKLGHNV
jgi:hypothetical protein